MNKFYLSVFLFLLSSTVYWNTLNNEFVWDDHLIIFNNRYIVELSSENLTEFFINKGVYFAPGEIYRPLYMTSFAFNYWLSGYNPSGYHLTNIVLHALNTVLVFLVMGFMSKVDSEDLHRRGRLSPFLIAIIFAVHPIHTESVAWVKGRDDLMALFFMLIAFYLYMKSETRRQKTEEKVNNLRLTIHYLLSLLFYICALLSKEMAITFPLILMLYDFIIVKKFAISTIHDSRFRIHHLIRYLPFWILSLVYMVVRTVVMGQIAQTEYLGGHFLSAMYTMTRGIVSYMRLLVLPFGLSGDYKTFLVSYSMDSSVVTSLFIIVSVFLLGVISVKYLRWISFGILWFFITLLPVSNIIPLKIAIAERFLYTPSLGFSIVLATVLSGIGRGYRFSSVLNAGKTRVPGRGGVVILSLLVLFYSVLTVERNKVWKNEYTFWTDVVKRFPDNDRARYNLGNSFKDKGMFKEAVIEYKMTLELAPHSTDAHNNLGSVYQELGLLKEAEKEFKEVIRINPYHKGAHNNLGLVYYKIGLFDEAISNYRTALELNKGSKRVSGIYMSLGEVYGKKGLIEEAIKEYENALRADPEQAAVIRYNLGRILSNNGLLEEAVKEYREALRLKPELVYARNNLGVSLGKLGLIDEAIEEFKVALEIRPMDISARYNLGSAYMQKGDCSSAMRELRSILKIEPGNQGALELLKRCQGS